MSIELKPEVSFVTPKGVLVFPYLVEPDDYQGDLSYKTGILIDPVNDSVAADLIAAIDAAVDTAFDEGVAELKAKGGKSAATAKQIEKCYPYEAQYDDNGEETGKIILKAKSKASGVTKAGKAWERKIPLFDSQNNQIPHGSARVYGGTVARLELITNTYCAPGLKKAGVNFYIKAGQVISLSGSGGSTSSSFGVEEDGYVAPSDADSSFDGEDDNTPTEDDGDY